MDNQHDVRVSGAYTACLSSIASRLALPALLVICGLILCQVAVPVAWARKPAILAPEGATDDGGYHGGGAHDGEDIIYGGHQGRDKKGPRGGSKEYGEGTADDPRDLYRDDPMADDESDFWGQWWDHNDDWWGPAGNGNGINWAGGGGGASWASYAEPGNAAGGLVNPESGSLSLSADDALLKWAGGTWRHHRSYCSRVARLDPNVEELAIQGKHWEVECLTAQIWGEWGFAPQGSWDHVVAHLASFDRYEFGWAVPWFWDDPNDPEQGWNHYYVPPWIFHGGMMHYTLPEHIEGMVASADPNKMTILVSPSGLFDPDPDGPGPLPERWEDFLIDRYVLFTSGFNAGEVRPISDFTDSSLTWDEPLAQAPGQGDTFVVMDRFKAWLSDSGEKGSWDYWLFAGLHRTWQEQAGVMVKHIDRDGNREIYYYDLGDEGTGRIDRIELLPAGKSRGQGHTIEYTYIVEEGPNEGRINDLVVYTRNHRPLQASLYTYHDGESYDEDCGAAGDLLMVQSFDNITDIGLADSGSESTIVDSQLDFDYYPTRDYAIVFLEGAHKGRVRNLTGYNANTHTLTFAVLESVVTEQERYAIIGGDVFNVFTTQYRYCTPAEDAEHQLSHILTNDDVCCAVYKLGTVNEPLGLLQHDNEDIEDYILYHIVYNSDPGSANIVGFLGTENLQDTFGCSLVDAGPSETEVGTILPGSVAYVTANESCGPECAGKARSAKHTFHYLTVNGDAAAANEVKNLVVEDVTSSDGITKYYRNIIGLNKDAVQIRHVIVTDPSSPRYWCTSKIVGTSGVEANKVLQERMPSAHTCVTTESDVRKFVDPTGNSGANDTDTLNDQTGLIRVTEYEYSFDGEEADWHDYEYPAYTGYTKWVGAAQGQNGLAKDQAGQYTNVKWLGYVKYGTDQSLAQYKSTMPVTQLMESYRCVDDTTTKPLPTSVATTDKAVYTYTYHDDAKTKVKTKTVTFPIVTGDNNGPGTAAVSKKYYDENGWLRWEKGSNGRVSYYAPNPDLSGVAYTVEDVDTDSNGGQLPAEIQNGDNSGGSGEDLLWVGWDDSSPPDGFEQTDSALASVSMSQYDDEGRTVTATDSSESESYVVYRFRQTRTYPGWHEEASSYQTHFPVQVAVEDGAGRVIECYGFDSAAAGVTLGEGDGLPTGYDTVPLSSYTYRTVKGYNTKGRLAYTRQYYDIVSGLYLETSYTYTDFGLQQSETQPDGTVTWYEYDVLGRVVETWKGTNASGATTGDPGDSTHPANEDNNMVKISTIEYDYGLVGDGLVTEMRTYRDGSNYYATRYLYDWQDRRRQTREPSGMTMKETLDSADRVIAVDRYYDANADWAIDSGELLTRGTTEYDEMGRVCRTTDYEVIRGTAGDYLVTNYWRDADGNLVKTEYPTGAFEKIKYDGLGREIGSYLCYGTDSDYDDACSVDDNTVIEQVLTEYEVFGEPWLVRSYLRNDGASGTGELTTSNARVDYTAYWYDDAHRLIKAVDYGLNDGAATTITTKTSGDFNPEVSGDQLYDDTSNPPAPRTTHTSECKYVCETYEYDAANRLCKTTDNMGRSWEITYDALSRVVQTVGNPDDSDPGVDEGDYDCDSTTTYEYDDLGRLATVSDKNPKGTGGAFEVKSQDTCYVYGSPYDGSWVTAFVFPDSNDSLTPGGDGEWTIGSGDDHVSVTFDRMGRVVTLTDQREVVHTYTYDASYGFLTSDEATIPTGAADDAIVEICYTYDDFGRLETVTSYDDSSNAKNEVKYHYDGWGNITKSYQDHSGAVDDDGQNGDDSFYVGYTYEDGQESNVAKYVRLANMTYPDGRDVHYNYGTDDIGARLSRLDNIANNSDGTIKYAQYAYLGAGAVIKVAHPAVQGGLNLVYGSGGTYAGIDHLGRIKQQKWQDDTASPNTVIRDHYTYRYDYYDNPIFRKNELQSDLSELYRADDTSTGTVHYDGYDDMDRLVEFYRGVLNAEGDGIDSSTTPSRQEEFGYDALGNWLTWDVSIDGSLVLDQLREHNIFNEIDTTDDHSDAVGNSITVASTGINWTDPAYDASGNMTTVPQPSVPNSAYTCMYDAWNRLVKVVSGETTVAEYRYDGLHGRIAKLVPNGSDWDRTDYYLNDDWQIVEERFDTVQAAQKETPVTAMGYQYVWDVRYEDALICRDKDTSDGLGGNPDGDCTDSDDEHVFYCHDANFNVTALVEGSSGDVVERYYYSPYGEPTVLHGDAGADLDIGGGEAEWDVDADGTDWANEILFCGYRYDPETGFYRVRNRDYHSTLGRWLQQDPAGYVNGINLYQYCLGNPTAYVDPSGLEGQTVGGVIGGGLTTGQLIPYDTRPSDIIGGLPSSGDPETDTFLARWSAVSGGFLDGFFDPNSAMLTILLGSGVGALGSCSEFAAVANMIDAYGTIRDFEATLKMLKTLRSQNVTPEQMYEIGYALGQGAQAHVIAGAMQAIQDAGLKPCFAAGTPVATAEGLVPIEDLRVGQRVLTSDGQETAGELEDMRLVTPVDPATWRLVRLQMRRSHREGDYVDVATLRPISWLQAAGCRPGRIIGFRMPEMGLDGQAKVVSVEPCPTIAAGDGRVILATVTSLARDPLELRIEGESEPLRLTTTHRLYSETRGDWVPAGELAVGDQVRTAQGPRRVESVQPLSGAHRVYNLEVQTRHCYHVGQTGVLSHNAQSCPGSYTIEFESGKKYHGKGSPSRARRSARRLSRKHNDKVKDVDWAPSRNNHQAFIDEAHRIRNDGGVRNPNNYNVINSPGAKYIK